MAKKTSRIAAGFGRAWARFREESGATAIEYALIAGLIGVALIGALGLIGTNVGNLFNTVATEVADAAPAEEE